MQEAVDKINRVMIIDDDEVDQMVYQRIIKRSDMVEEFVAFTYAEEALEYLKSNPKTNVDVIFLDINMPRMNGFEFLERAVEDLGDQFTSAVVIMLTTSLDPRDVERARQFEVVKKYLDKPLQIEDLREVAALLRESADSSFLRSEQSDRGAVA
ncbi:MAG: response regulator [Pseudomonadota bacterium]